MKEGGNESGRGDTGEAGKKDDGVATEPNTERPKSASPEVTETKKPTRKVCLQSVIAYRLVEHNGCHIINISLIKRK